jgi:hypothetical protein
MRKAGPEIAAVVALASALGLCGCNQPATKLEAVRTATAVAVASPQPHVAEPVLLEPASQSSQAPRVSPLVSGKLSGLRAGQSLVLQNANGEELRLTSNGGFSFSTGAGDPEREELAIKRRPAGQSCRVEKDPVLQVGADVIHVSVICRAVQDG